MWIKICGLKQVSDGRAAVEAAPDAVGFVFAPSKRQISPELAKEISAELPASVQRVGVFVDEKPATVKALYKSLQLDWVQLHGQESLAYCLSLKLPLIKALSLHEESALSLLTAYAPYPVLLDARQPGGGQLIDWQLAAKAASLHPRIILAGGLDPDNIGAAITQVRPYGVDVSSGVEYAGRKDSERMQRFVRSARAAASRGHS